jgi:hypothetical protein
MALSLSSSSFNDGDDLGHDHMLSAAYGFGGAGGNQSPPFSWSGVPAAKADLMGLYKSASGSGLQAHHLGWQTRALFSCTCTKRRSS